MLAKPFECKGCSLYGTGRGFVMPDGYNTRKVYIVGEAAGQHEENIGKPFVKYAQAGSKLDEIFRLAGYQRDNFKILNVVNCRPPNNKLEYTPYETPAVEHCRVHFEKEVKPNGKNVIFTLGNVPFKALTGYSGIKKESITLMRGYIYESKYGYIVPSLHPSYIKRGKPSYTPYLIYDLAKAVKLSKRISGEPNKDNGNANEAEEMLSNKSGQQLAKAHYNEFPSHDDILGFYYKVKDNPNLMLAYDIETPYSPELDEDERENLDDKEITQIQFSLIKGEAIAFPFSSEYLPFIKLLFLTSNDKIGHNSFNFDNPRLRANNLKLKGTLHDSMWMFKQWQPALLRNLQSVASLFNYPMPWKHLFNTELRWYGCADVDSIQYIYPKLKELMIQEGIYDSYMNHVVNFFPILQDAASRGIPVNEERRVELKGYLEQERIKIDDEIQKLVPEHLKLLGPVKKDKETKEVINTGYKNTPKVIKEEWIRYSSIKDQWDGRNLKSEPYPYNFAEYLARRVQVVKDNKGKIKDRFTYILKPVEVTIEGVTHYKGKWHKQHFFKPSKDQLVKYIEWKRDSLLVSNDIYERRLARKYIVPTKITKQGEPKKTTTGGKALAELLESTYDEVIRLIIGDPKYETDTLMNRVGIRSIDTNINNYIKNWKAKPDGCVHTQFGFTAASGQLDSRSPNVLNCSKHTITGQLFRRIIEAPKDYVFIEFDFRSFHVATAGFIANDPEYIRFSQLDPHSFFTAQYVNDLSLPIPRFDMSNEEIISICKLYKEKYKLERQFVTKPVVLGNQLGLGAKKIWLQNKKYFKGYYDAAEKQNILNSLFPKIPKFKKEVKELAHSQQKLINNFGYLQRFYEVFKWQYDHELSALTRVQGSEAEKAIAFLVQANAFGKIRDNLIEMDKLGYLEKYNFINSIHDSVIFMPNKRDFEECIYNVKAVLESPCKQLLNEATKSTGGLVVGVEASYGNNWQNYDPIANPTGIREFKFK